MRRGLNDKQWAQIEPHLPTNQTGSALTIDALSAVSFKHFGAAHAGATARPTMVPTRRSKIVSIAGLSTSDQLSPSLLAKLPLEPCCFLRESMLARGHEFPL